MEKNNWEYYDTHDNGKRKFEIIPPDNEKKVKPATLFKYYALNCNSVNALENRQIYAADRWQLNDAFDCHEKLIDFNNLSEQAKEALTNTYPNFSLNQCLKIYYHQFYNFYGIVSMTESPKDTRMWAHYAKNSGFVIEYDYNKFDVNLFLGPFQVNYKADFDPATIDSSLGYEAHLYQTNVKHIIWKDECEWRFIAFKNKAMHIPGIGEDQTVKANRLFSCNDSISSITLGHNFFEIRKEIIPIPDKDEVHFVVSDKKLRVINFAFNNNIDIYWILHPDYLHDSSYNLRRKKLMIERVNGNRFKILNHKELGQA